MSELHLHKACAVRGLNAISSFRWASKEIVRIRVFVIHSVV